MRDFFSMAQKKYTSYLYIPSFFLHIGEKHQRCCELTDKLCSYIHSVGCFLFVCCSDSIIMRVSKLIVLLLILQMSDMMAASENTYAYLAC